MSSIGCCLGGIVTNGVDVGTTGGKTDVNRILKKGIGEL